MIRIILALLLLTSSAHAQIGPSPTPPLNGLPGQPAGPLGPDGRVPDTQLTVSAFQYKGTWNAATNTPTLADGAGTVGDTYEIAVSGTQNLGGGSVNYLSGNLLLYNGTVWQQAGSGNIPVPANPTSSVGTSAVNGVASTFMPSDAAPAINQGIAPTWTGTHTFSPGGINQLNISSSDLAAGAAYNPVNPKSLATKQYVDNATGGGPTLASGTYTPSVTFTNNASTSFIGLFIYQRVGSVVSVTGRFTAAVANSASSGNVRLTLPVASNFTNTNQLTGFGVSSLSPGVGAMTAISFSGDNSASMTIWATGTGSIDYAVSYSYTVQ